MSKPSPSRPWSLLAAAALCGSSLVFAPSGAGAETTDETDHAQTVIDALLELGVSQEVIDDQFGDNIRRSVGELIEAGVVAREDVVALREDIRNERVAEAVEERQERAEEHRQAHRANVAEVLGAYGVVLEDGQTVAEALDAAGVDAEVVRDEVKARNEAEREARQAEREVEREERQAEREERQGEREVEREERQGEREVEREERQGEREVEREERQGEREVEREERQGEREAEREERQADRGERPNRGDQAPAAQPADEPVGIELAPEPTPADS